ncbi:hypothetical protein SAY86_002807 [Trapa natans]|uniref:V-type proton ATPase subunit S1/VOA1 transmembrane domain-containing protein n=1 Tax=Trapa natans TaxID=22666 RepID=A0AAN7LDX0_TRANT|nr:hypothetical protein SAY86_002807 [Trapa natans]
MKMAVVLALMLLALIVPLSSASPSTVPAFLWSPHYDRISDDIIMESVDYQTISPKDLTKAVLSQGGWSDLLCSAKKLQQQTDLAVIFVGRELQSLDKPSKKHEESALVNLLKEFHTKSNFSLVFPYVDASSEDAMENLLVSGFNEACGHDLDITKVALLGSCSVLADDSQKIADLQSLHDYFVLRRERRLEGNADIIMFCHGESAASDEYETPSSEGEIFSELIRSLDQLEEKYSVLYVSDPSRSIQYPSMRELERFLVESAGGNASTNGTCDGICQVKSSLLEGLLVGIVLLIILICGLCCMAGIQTPTRFEAPQES